MKERFDHKLIFDLIPRGSRVLDLGCGNGDLLLQLSQEKNCYIQGMEIDPEAVCECISKGIPVIQADIDNGLKYYENNYFDFVILNKTLQATHKPLPVMKEALRVGKKVIVSFPNFGHYSIRSQLFFLGRMPRSRDLPYEWYNTPNIHLVTIKDFTNFCEEHEFKILKKIFYDDEKKILFNLLPNIRSPYAMFILDGKL